MKCDVVDEQGSKATKVAINFTVTDVKEPIVSMVKLCDAGARVTMQKDAAWIEFGDRAYELKFNRGRVYMGVVAGTNRKRGGGDRREVAANGFQDYFPDVRDDELEHEGAGGSSGSGGFAPPPGLEGLMDY